jgi:isoleucyl-tRNA synthetase
MTDKLDNYRLLEPVRAYRDFVDDLSTWYLRRSRDRIKEGDKEAKETLYFVLKQMSKLLAPLAPFYSEGLYQKLKTDVEPISVHLSLWPEQEESFFSRLAHRFNAKSDAPQGNESSKLISDMQETRRIVSIALEARSRANIKVRQPLQELRIKNADLKDEFKEIIREELNVKSVKVDQALSDDVELDTELTEELKDEGRMRDIVRAIQDLRKEKNLKPEDSMDYEIAEDEREIFSKFRTEIEKVTNIKIANL